MRITPIPPESFRQTPWKNGGGVSLTIAEGRAPGSSPGDWSSVIWQLGRTTISVPGPFSDLTGFERLQTVIAGHGLVLETPAGEIDLRTPLTIARYDGGLNIKSRLESGAVQVVNLMARRLAASIDMRVLRAGDAAALPAGHHIVYAFGNAAGLAVDDTVCTLGAGHAATIDGPARLECRTDALVVASVRQAISS